MGGAAPANIQLRDLRADDAEAIAAYCDDWQLARATGRLPFPYGRDHAVRFLAAPPADEARWAIALGDALIGVVGWRRPKAGVAADFGYWIGRTHWRRGFGSIAAAAALTRLFADREAEETRATVFQDNPASARVLAKCGFRWIGVGMGDSLARRGAFGTWLFALTRAEWMQREAAA